MEEEKLIEREIISDAVAAGKGEHQGVQMHAIDDDDFESLTDSKKKIKSASKRAGMTVKAKKKPLLRAE
ncbi:MAG: hypothetical protein WC308_02475 [archaeon]|jgi:hypothetical protein